MSELESLGDEELLLGLKPGEFCERDGVVYARGTDGTCAVMPLDVWRYVREHGALPKPGAGLEEMLARTALINRAEPEPGDPSRGFVTVEVIGR